MSHALYVGTVLCGRAHLQLSFRTVLHSRPVGHSKNYYWGATAPQTRAMMLPHSLPQTVGDDVLKVADWEGVRGSHRSFSGDPVNPPEPSFAQASSNFALGHWVMVPATPLPKELALFSPRLAMALAVAWPALSSNEGVRDLDGVLVTSHDTVLDEQCMAAKLKIVSFHVLIDNLDADNGLVSLIEHIMRVRNGGFLWVSHFWSGISHSWLRLPTLGGQDLRWSFGRCGWL